MKVKNSRSCLWNHPPNHPYFQLLLWNHPRNSLKIKVSLTFFVGSAASPQSSSPTRTLQCFRTASQRVSFGSSNMARGGKKIQMVHLYPLSDFQMYFRLGKWKFFPFAMLVWMGNWVDFVSSMAHNCQANMPEMPRTCEKKVVGKRSENL